MSAGGDCCSRAMLPELLAGQETMISWVGASGAVACLRHVSGACSSHGRGGDFKCCCLSNLCCVWDATAFWEGGIVYVAVDRVGIVWGGSCKAEVGVFCCDGG